MMCVLVRGAGVTAKCPITEPPAPLTHSYWGRRMAKPHLSGPVNGQYKHGRKHTTEYASWAHMVQRCTNPKNRAWKNYGGRGIEICTEWREDFRAFFAHIGPKPAPDLSIERIDNNRGYEPGNVKWATASEQAKNRRPFKIGKLKPTCPSGHAYEGTNIYWLKNGVRRCLICKREQGRRRVKSV